MFVIHRLPIMTFELYKLSDSATGGAEHVFADWMTALAQIAMVSLGAIYRFVANENRSDAEGKNSILQIVVASTSFTASFVIYVGITWAILEPIFTEKCKPDSPSDMMTKCEINGTAEQRDMLAVYVFTLVWIGYPMVSLTSLCFSGVSSNNSGYKLGQRTSFYKDIAYGFLDIVSKAGLAFYAAYRSRWVA